MTAKTDASRGTTAASGRLAQIRRELLNEIEQRRDEFVELCAEVVRRPTENPPGDTRALADFVAGWLQKQGISSQFVEPQPTMRSLLSTFNEERAPSLHWMFNGHLDIFPADDPSLWKIPPFEGRVTDGRIHGRGVADMKAGTTASIIAYSLLYRYREAIPARVSLMAVADEETGGIWGTSWILQNKPEWLPDACMIGEPCAPDAVRVGEKGISWLKVTCHGRSYHGSLGMGQNCILQLAEVLLLLRDVTKLRATIPDDLKSVIEGAKSFNLNEDTRGRASLFEHPSYNPGVIAGGIKCNIAPREAMAEVDIRIPFGWTPEQILSWTRQRLDEAGMKDVDLELPPYRSAPNYTSPNHPLAQIIARNAAEHYGKPATFTMTTGATDGRYFRQQGIPTIIYGPRPQGVAGLDEYVEIADFMAVLKGHTCSAIDYIAQTAKG
ncbi:MAG: M20 family metallopeptidase [Chloroflexi bacterium]|nr:M20 family metallopeptidase [Chloroflexota bacterium]